MSKTEYMRVVMARDTERIADSAAREYKRRRVELTAREELEETGEEIRRAVSGLGWMLAID